MFDFLKKIFTSKQIISEEPRINEDLINKLTELSNTPNLNNLFFSPISKIFLINTYTNDFIELTSNLYNYKFHKSSLNAINLYSYFDNNSIDFHDQMSKLILHLPTLKISKTIEHDLYELYTTYTELLKMENNNV